MTTLCSGAAIWLVESDVPVSEPSWVKYDWHDGTGVHEIEGDDYSITEEITTRPSELYDVTVRYKWNQGDDPLRIATFKSVPGPIGGPGTYEPENPENYYGIKYANQGSTTDYNKYPWIVGVNNRFRPLLVLGMNYLFGVAWNGTAFYVVLGVTAVRSKDELQDIDYNLKIFKNGLLVYSQTKETNPSANVIAGACLYKNNWKSAYKEINLNPNAYLKVEYEGKNAILSKCEMPEIESFNESQCQVVKRIKGTCNKPSLRATSEPLCPPGTCELSCQGSLCCYNQYGIVVRSYAGAGI